jgi:hypothetical protein
MPLQIVRASVDKRPFPQIGKRNGLLIFAILEKGSDFVLVVRQTGPGSRIFSQPVLIGGFELLDLVQAGKGGAAHLGREG